MLMVALTATPTKVHATIKHNHTPNQIMTTQHQPHKQSLYTTTATNGGDANHNRNTDNDGDSVNDTYKWDGKYDDGGNDNGDNNNTNKPLQPH